MTRVSSNPKHLWKNTPAGVPCWHIHHDELMEISTEPLADRAKYIRENKPSSEVEIRLRLMRPVIGKLPIALRKAYAAYDTAYAANIAKIKALHKTECPDCPWNGKTIFPKKGPKQNANSR